MTALDISTDTHLDAVRASERRFPRGSHARRQPRCPRAAPQRHTAARRDRRDRRTDPGRRGRARVRGPGSVGGRRSDPGERSRVRRRRIRSDRAGRAARGTTRAHHRGASPIAVHPGVGAQRQAVADQVCAGSTLDAGERVAAARRPGTIVGHVRRRPARCAPTHASDLDGDRSGGVGHRGLLPTLEYAQLVEEGAQVQVLAQPLGGSLPVGPGVLIQQWKMSGLETEARAAGLLSES